jgi:hypothetical protein
VIILLKNCFVTLPVDVDRPGEAHKSCFLLTPTQIHVNVRSSEVEQSMDIFHVCKNCQKCGFAYTTYVEKSEIEILNQGRRFFPVIWLCLYCLHLVVLYEVLK